MANPKQLRRRVPLPELGAGKDGWIIARIYRYAEYCGKKFGMGEI
jgi:hypothetical protein